MRILCKTCGNAILLWDRETFFDVCEFDKIAKCCNNPNYWEIDDYDNIIE